MTAPARNPGQRSIFSVLLRASGPPLLYRVSVCHRTETSGRTWQGSTFYISSSSKIRCHFLEWGGGRILLRVQFWSGSSTHVGRCTGMEGKIFSCIGVEENESEVLSRRPSAATTTMLWAGGCTAGARSRWADVAACMAGAHRRLTPPPALRSLSQPERTMAAYAGDQPRWSFCFKGYLQKS